MIQKIEEIFAALSAGLYNCALALTLTLPDICAKVEYRDKNWGNGRRYQTWFNTFAKDKFTFDTVTLPSNEISKYNTIDAATCWEIRCAVLHAGNYNSSAYKERRFNRISFHAHKPDGPIWEHEIVDGDRIEIDVIKFCNLLCGAVKDYYEMIVDKSIFDVDEVKILNW